MSRHCVKYSRNQKDYVFAEYTIIIVFVKICYITYSHVHIYDTVDDNIPPL
jgi:hypothetical protein